LARCAFYVRSARLSNRPASRVTSFSALARGVWGVPTFSVKGELFWGADSFPLLLEFLRDPGLFESPEMKRLETLPVGAARS
jgi:hypothetical protein